MASGVNVKMGVTGVAQFKQNINTAKQSLKTLDAQLALNEKQFKATGDSEAYMQEKSELLKVKLEEQKAIAANAEKALKDMTANGVDKASKAYQDMQRQLLEARGGMLDTEAAMNDVANAGDAASDAASDLHNQLKGVGEGINYQNVTSALTSISEGMDAAIKKAVDLGKKIVKDVLGAGSWADDLNTLAAFYQIPQERLQRMEKTAQLIDTPVEAILNAQKKLNKAVAKGSKETMGAFAALGLDPRDAKDAEDRFWKVGDAIMRLGDEEDKEYYAQQLLGRSWNELIPLFTAGREEYDKLNESWKVVPQESVDALQGMDDQYQTLKNDLETVQRQLEAAFAPAMTKVMETVTSLLGKFNDYLQTENGKAMIEALSGAMSSLFDDLANVDPDKVMNTITGIIDKLKEGLEWIKDNKDGVVTAVKAFIGAWALVKTSVGVARVLQLVSGIRGLAAGSAAAGAAEAGAATGSSWGAAFASAVMKAAPWLVGLYAMLNPSDTGNDDLVDENGGVTEVGNKVGIKIDKEGKVTLPETTMVKSEMHGKFTDPQYQMLQEYWDKYRTGKAGNDDWAKLQEEFGKSDVYMANFLEIAKQIYGLDRNLEDLPDEIFGGEATAEAAEKMERTADTLNGTNEAQQKSSDEISAAADKIDKAAGDIYDGVCKAVSGITVNIDGQAAGEILAPYVGGAMGRQVLTDQ